MSADAKNMWMVVPTLGNGGPVQRVSMDTLDPQTYSSTKASHDIAAVSGSLMAYIDYGTTCNGIIEIDPSGTTKKVFDAQGVVPSSGCHGTGPVGGGAIVTSTPASRYRPRAGPARAP